MGTNAPYQPMHPPKKTVTQQEMLAILEKRQPKESAIQRKQGPVPPAPEDPPKILQWQAPVIHADGTGYMESQCLRYTVDKVKVMGKFRYTAHKRLSEWSFTLGCEDSAKEAQSLCEQNAKGGARCDE